jgi:hypothetical protein
MVLVALQISTIPGSMGRCEPVRGGLTPMRQHPSQAPLEGGRRVDSCRMATQDRTRSVDGANRR